MELRAEVAVVREVVVDGRVYAVDGGYAADVGAVVAAVVDAVVDDVVDAVVVADVAVLAYAVAFVEAQVVDFVASLNAADHKL